MRVPIDWLREYVAVDASAEELAGKLGTATCEVERIIHRGVADEDGNLGFYRVGRVLEAGKHPNADRLQLTRVDVGEGEPRQIVCGAWNFGAGATVAVALPGAVLPGGTRLEEAKLRGEVSRGMILSERELELGPDHTGILVLTDGPEPGTPLADVFPLGEDVLEVETTPNRPDLLSVYGFAREVAALYGADLSPLDLSGGQSLGHGQKEQVDVRVEDLDGCPRYIGRLFRDVRIASSPPWLKARLVASGMRPISNVVDVTNYVMQALGNPLHAFDLTKLEEERIVVRRAAAGETMRTLDGEERRLEPTDLVIADASRPVALAGIMGSEDSEVDESTTSVLLEAANFEPIGILKSSERLGLRTEGSNRWEKGVDPHLAEPAAQLATRLIAELAGARLTGETEVAADLPERAVVRYRPARADELIGLEIDRGEQRRTLEGLSFDVQADDEASWTVIVPTWRGRDVTREADLVEEVARFRLSEIPFTLPLRRELRGRLTREQRLRRLVEEVLVGCGCSEIYTSSLIADDPHPDAIRLPTPLTAAQAVLRTTLLEGLVAAAHGNVDAGNEGIRLFELARVYLPPADPRPDERWHVGAIVDGGFAPAKGILERLLSALKVEPRFDRTRERFLHPGKAARLDGGWVGELHPERLEGRWGVFELDLPTLFARVPERLVYEDVISYPALRQDLAFAVAEEVAAGELVEAAREAAGPELREMRPFDVYRGEQIGPGRKSIAFRVVYQSPERTLTDEDAAALRERIVEALVDRFRAELRA
ncbi:MAG TPA: phenylalanine--tRNA ligase subunit beta [Gaiellaceae bacterium]|nr:phenylalanine--tRNA ligase subunit beta [Gaiellaceae bacterium]